MSEEIKMLGPASSYVDILYKAVEDAPAEPYTRVPLSPSQAGECTRALALKMQIFLGLLAFEIPANKPRIKMLLDLGNSVERHCIDWFKKAKAWFGSKYKQQVVELFEVAHGEYKFLIEGSSDDCFWSEKYKAVVDYKSKGDKWSDHRTSKWKEDSDKLDRIAHRFSENGWWVNDLAAFLAVLNDAHWASNFYQLNAYANTEFYKRRGVDHGCIIQYNKNDSSMREIRFKPSAEVYELTRLKFQAALEAAVSDIEKAPRDHTLGSYKCAYCDLRTLCRPDVDALKAFYKNNPKRWPTDTRRIEIGANLEEMFQGKKILEEGAEELERLNVEILGLLENAKINKIRLDNGDIYEVVYLKSPKPHAELRRSKL